MKVKSVKTNYILNLLRIFSSTVIGVVTMPYINSVLGPESLGKVEYVNSIVNYFILFSGLGIPLYGIRQVAKVRENKKELGKNVFEILGILFVTSFISTLILLLLAISSSYFTSYADLIFLMSSMILLNNLGAEWFFQGVEDQVYITIRYLIIRFITLILLFLFVKDSNDYVAYACIVVLNLCGSNLFNLIKISTYFKSEGIKFNQLNFLRHFKPALTIFLASISVNIYLQTSSFLLGFIAGDKYVGFYSAANKLMRYVVTFITAAGAVILPRLSNFWNNDVEKYNSYLKSTLNFIIMISLPCSLYFFLYAENIIKYMAGKEFNLAINTMKILSPVCFLVGLAYFFGYLVLYIQDREKYYTLAVSISAALSIILNIYLIKYLHHDGAAITQLISESLGVIIMLYFVTKFKLIKPFNYKNLLRIVFANIILVIFNWFINSFYGNHVNSFIQFLLVSLIFFGMYGLILILVREDLSIGYFRKFLKIKNY